MTQPSPGSKPRQVNKAPIDVGVLSQRSRTFSTPGTRPPHSLDATPPAFKANWTNTDQQTERHSTPKVRTVSAHFNYGVRLAVRHQSMNNVPAPSRAPSSNAIKRDINSAHSELRCATHCLSLDHEQCAHAVEQCHRATPSRDAIGLRHRTTPSSRGVKQRRRATPPSDAIERRHQPAPGLLGTQNFIGANHLEDQRRSSGDHQRTTHRR